MANKNNTETNDEIPDLVSDEESGEMEDDDEEMDAFEDEVGIEAFLATDDGETVCTVMVDINDTLGEIARQMTTTNRILVKMLTKLT